MIFSHQPTRLEPLSNEVKEKARSFFRLGFPLTPPKRSTFKPLSSKVKLARNKVIQRRKSKEVVEENDNQQFFNTNLTNKDATGMEASSFYFNNRRVPNLSSVTKPGIYSSIKPKLRASVGITTTTPKKESPQSTKSTHKPADLCYVLLCMGALLHAEPKPRACLRLFAYDGNEAEKVLFFAYLLGAPPGLPTRWLFPFVQKRIFSYLVGLPPHYIGLWNVGNWLEEKTEEVVDSDQL